MRRCLRRNQPGPYQVQAAIDAVHSDAADAAATDWAQIVQLYDQLMALAPTPVVALNRAVAVAEVAGPAAGLALVDGLDLARHHVLPRRPGGPAAPAGPARRGGRGVRRRRSSWPATTPSGRSSQRRRDELPASAPSPGGMTTPRPLDVTFTAPIEKDGAFATYLTVPDSAELFGTRRRSRSPARPTATRSPPRSCRPGAGPHWLPLRAAICTAIGKSRAGEEVTVHLQQRLS